VNALRHISACTSRSNARIFADPLAAAKGLPARDKADLVHVIAPLLAYRLPAGRVGAVPAERAAGKGPLLPGLHASAGAARHLEDSRAAAVHLHRDARQGGPMDSCRSGCRRNSASRRRRRSQARASRSHASPRATRAGSPGDIAKDCVVFVLSREQRVSLCRQIAFLSPGS